MLKTPENAIQAAEDCGENPPAEIFFLICLSNGVIAFNTTLHIAFMCQKEMFVSLL